MSEKRERGLAPLGRGSALSDLDWFDYPDALWRPARMRSLLGEMFGEGRPSARAFAPSVDVAENDDEYVITAELPGAKKEDVTVELHENVLTIRGEKRSEREEKKDQARYVERCYGTFSRSFSLPSNASEENPKASFQDGVLTIRVRKREEAKPRVINIQAG
ncbi:MAG TPA: Hsp20/alpha crystallin family protein [Myxococcota bacterium]